MLVGRTLCGTDWRQRDVEGNHDVEHQFILVCVPLRI